MEEFYDVVIVGAGHGGAQAAIALRAEKFSGSVLVIGDEPDLPYERPPLSKEYLAQERAFDRLLIRPASFWADRQVSFRLGTPVTAVDPSAHALTLAGGETIRYGVLIWAAGATPRRLSCSGHDLAGVHVVRSRADVDGLMADLPAVRHVVVVGGGYIGLEAAASLTKLGKSVTVIEAQDRVLARVAGEPLSRFYEAAHRAHGVVIALGATVDRLVGDDRVTGVHLGDGRVLAADLVVVGIGVVPNVGPLLDAAIVGTPASGVEIDEYCRTSAAAIYAIGDCARHANAFADGLRLRLESVQNANDQASTVAKSIVGRAEPYRAVPWFWSVQFDLRLQTVGLSGGHDAIVMRGDPAAGSVSFIYLKQGRVIALDCVNAPKDYVQGRALVAKGAAPDPVALANPLIPLKELAG